MGQIKPSNNGEHSIMFKNADKLSPMEKEGLLLLEEFKIAINLTKNYRQS